MFATITLLHALLLLNTSLSLVVAVVEPILEGSQPMVVVVVVVLAAIAVLSSVSQLVAVGL
jgi:hypothetical protein